MEGARAHMADTKAYIADAKACMAGTEVHTADVRALEQRIPSNRGFVFVRFPKVVKIP